MRKIVRFLCKLIFTAPPLKQITEHVSVRNVHISFIFLLFAYNKEAT